MSRTASPRHLLPMADAHVSTQLLEIHFTKDLALRCGQLCAGADKAQVDSGSLLERMEPLEGSDLQRMSAYHEQMLNSFGLEPDRGQLPRSDTNVFRQKCVEALAQREQ